MTYKLIIELMNPNMYQLLLRCNEKNLHMFVYADTSVANCKTAATALFNLSGVASFAWTDFASASYSSDLSAGTGGWTVVTIG